MDIMKGTDTGFPIPAVAVCLAVRNGLPWLSGQVASILAQEGVAVTLWVSVDASDDGSEHWIDQAAAADARIRVLPHGRPGDGAAGNFFRLLREADFSCCDLVAFADQDDLWHADKLHRAAQQLRAHRADAYSSDVIAFWPDGRETRVAKSQPKRRWDHLFESAGPGCTYVLRQPLAVALQSTVRADPEAAAGVAYHDWFAYAFARARGLAWHIDDRPGLRYRQHERNVLGAHDGWRAAYRRLTRLLCGSHLEQARRVARASGSADDPAVRAMLFNGRRGLLRLALHAHHCRRRRRDRLALMLASLWLALRGAPPA